MNNMRFGWWKRACAVCVLCAAAAIASPAQTFTNLFNFNGSDGYGPAFMSLVQGTDGNLYGTAASGGAYDQGTIFKISAAGALTTLHNFTGTWDGGGPIGLVPSTNGDFYGAAAGGGNLNDGTIFRITPAGALSRLHSFVGSDGADPQAALVQGNDGNFYGTTVDGGNSNSFCFVTCGTVFKMTPAGAFTTLYRFCAQATCPDGANPFAGLLLGNDGNFYGVANAGGANDSICTTGCGTVFRITSTGTLTTLHSFDSTDGAGPGGGLVQAANGNFYGTTSSGGANIGYGTVFEITAGGTLTTLHSFDGTDGSEPEAALVQGNDGNLYGTTNFGGPNECSGFSCGTVFEITPEGVLKTLHSFDGTDGFQPLDGLLQATNGIFYGTTTAGGANNTCMDGCGTVFSLSVGLRPFVETQPTSGKVGTAVEILGTHLTGSTSVTFNGTAAVFKVVSSTEITTTVPTGATTGTVQVGTPSGTLSSNMPFRVLP